MFRPPKLSLGAPLTRGITPRRETSGRNHLRGLAPGQRCSVETSQRWRAAADTGSDLTGTESNRQPRTLLAVSLATAPAGQSF